MASGISRRLTGAVAISSAVVAMIPGAAVGHAHDDGLPSYAIVDLGTLPQNPGGYCSTAGLNDQGEVVGAVGQSGGVSDAAFAFLWRDGVMIDLSGFPGFTHSVANGINQEGDVVGHSYTTVSPTRFQSWFWQEDRFTALSTALAPVAINSSRRVAGSVESTATAPRTAAVWNHGVLTLLPPAGYQSDATAINDRGVVVGEVNVRGPGSNTIVHAVKWQNGGVTDLGRLGPAFGNEGAFPTAIDERAWIVGQSNAPGAHDHAFLWRAGLMTDLGTAPGFTESRANGINERDIVGNSRIYSKALGRWVLRATLWRDGRAIDLNRLKPTGFTGTLVNANGINHKGQIIGAFSADPYAPNSYNNRCFIMTPAN